ncbi:MAG: segregation/condensation protein A [Candidatus Aenigmarchaeota archaeon]|nr:segregation/condensation protein A [Candidatus Aenigmarchaeota archaeon]
MDNSQLLDRVTAPGSWEQVIYDVIAFEGLDPWDIDLSGLAEGFVKYLQGMKEMDFKLPAKYLMVAATLLRMKSDHLPLLDYFQEEPEAVELEDGIEENRAGTSKENLPLLAIPPRRVHRRRIVVSELVDALRKVMSSSARREMRTERARGTIKISEDDIGKRISTLYDKINSILSRIKGSEVRFKEVVPVWERKEVANTFLPLIYLDHQRKVECRQEEMFDEIYIKQIKENNSVRKLRKEKKVKTRTTTKTKVKAPVRAARKQLKRRKRGKKVN